MKIKFNRNMILIGVIFGFIVYCTINGCSLKEGMTKKEKKKTIMGKMGGVASSALNATANTAVSGIKNVAKVGGKTVNVMKTAGKIFTNQANRKTGE